MKQNLMVQFVYPSYDIPTEYKEAIETIDHVKIMPLDSEHIISADVVVFNSCKEFVERKAEVLEGKVFVLRTQGKDVLHNIPTFECDSRLNIIITDIDIFTEKDFDTYKQWLSELKTEINKIYCNGKTSQINILTDRILLEKMNNCNAGYENVTLAPNGEFYVCPAFYIENEKDSIGNLKNGLNLKNSQLYKLEYAPLCRICDAYQCKRCVWLNRRTTLEVNTPSHEQCVVAHLERNTSEQLLNELKAVGYFSDKEISVINYLDPFETITN
jgi:CXXX repeat peptide maturase